MANPWDELAAYADSVTDSRVNVYATVTPNIVPPAVVIRPDDPWRETGPAFCFDTQRYVVVIVVAPAYPDDGTALMYDIQNDLLRTLPEGWDWASIGGIVLDSSTDTDLLASALRLTYRNSDIGEAS